MKQLTSPFYGRKQAAFFWADNSFNSINSAKQLQQFQTLTLKRQFISNFKTN